MQNEEKEINFKDLFIPLTTKKAIIIISIVGFVVYFNSLFNNFVWDDYPYIVNSQLINNFDWLHFFSSNVFNSAEFFYRPFSIIYFALIHIIFGNNAFIFHLFQLVINILNTIIIFFIFKKFFPSILSLFLSLAFLIHPLTVESVVFIGGTTGPLTFLLGISAFLLSTKPVLKKLNYFIISFLLLLSLLTKESGILFVPLILLFSLLFRRKCFKQLFLAELISIFSYLAIRFTFVGIAFSQNKSIPILQASLYEKLISVPKILFYYFQNTIFPLNILTFQLWVVKKITISDFVIPLVFVGLFLMLISCEGIVLLVIPKFKKSVKPYFFFLIWFLMGVVLLLPFFPLDMTVSDRWFYFPFVGLLGLIGIAVELTIKNKGKRFKRFLVIGVTLLLLLYSVRTVVRNTNWYDNLKLFSQDSHGQESYGVEDNLAVALEQKGNFKQALTHAKKAVSLLPSDVDFHDLASIDEDLGDKKNAIKYYYASSKATGYIAGANHLLIIDQKLGRAILLYGNTTYAKNFLEESLKDYPNNSLLKSELAICLYVLGDKEKAIVIAKGVYTQSNAPASDGSFTLYNLMQTGQPASTAIKMLSP